MHADTQRRSESVGGEVAQFGASPIQPGYEYETPLGAVRTAVAPVGSAHPTMYDITSRPSAVAISSRVCRLLAASLFAASLFAASLFAASLFAASLFAARSSFSTVASFTSSRSVTQLASRSSS